MTKEEIQTFYHTVYKTPWDLVIAYLSDLISWHFLFYSALATVAFIWLSTCNTIYSLRSSKGLLLSFTQIFAQSHHFREVFLLIL